MQLDSPSMQQLLAVHVVIGDAACMCATFPDCRLATARRALSPLVMRHAGAASSLTLPPSASHGPGQLEM
jgi:hypothetical protein